MGFSGQGRGGAGMGFSRCGDDWTLLSGTRKPQPTPESASESATARAVDNHCWAATCLRLIRAISATSSAAIGSESG